MSFTAAIIMFLAIPAVVIPIALFRKGNVSAALSLGCLSFKLESTDTEDRHRRSRSDGLTA